MNHDAYTVEQYFKDDYARTLFPLSTTMFLVEQFSARVKDFLYNKLLHGSSDVAGFLVQRRCYAAKRGYALRRTVKLDPVAEFFIYDLIFRNRKSFRKDYRKDRQSFGYRFDKGRPQSTTDAYATFKRALTFSRTKYPFTLKVDIATYFNSVYHHDLVALVRGIEWPDSDVEALGRFLREINAGRSVDCLPQGLHPCKALGSEFLRFIENSHRLRSAHTVRFLDDIHFFDADLDVLNSDYLTLQQLLGERGLSLNDAKTELGPISTVDIPQEVDAMKQTLLRMRRETIEVSGQQVEVLRSETRPLAQDQVEYLLRLLQTPDIEESDAELVLILLRNHGEEFLPKVRDLLRKFPGLARNIYYYAASVLNREPLAEIIADFLRNTNYATEYQLFWLVKLAEDFLSDSPQYGAILCSAIDHVNATSITRSKVLEIPERRFGLPQLREEVLRSGRSDWEAWAAAVGSRAEPAANRNHLLGYFAKGSPLNNLVAECVKAVR